MSVLDRMHKREQERALTEETSGKPGQSITPAAKSAVISRLEFVINTLHQYIVENDDSGAMSRFSFVTRAMIEEIGEELSERDEATMQRFMAQIGQIIAWIGHGDADQLPENLRDFVKVRPAIEQAS